MNFYMGIKDLEFRSYGLKTTASRSIFWPCYRLAVSVESRDEIDPFAKVVLQMAYCGITDTDELSQQLCLDKDFVKLLQAKLVHKDFLDKAHHITEETKKLMDQEENGMPKSSATKKVCYIFMDALTGTVLPFVTQDSAIDSIVSCDQQNGFVSFIGRENKPIMGPIVGHNENFMFRAPSRRECLKACRKGDFYKVGSVELISKEKTNAELVLLHLTAFIQYGQTKVFVSGLNTSISDKFTEYVAENSSKFEWVYKLRDKSKSNLEDEEKKEKIEHYFLYRDISKKIESNNQKWEQVEKRSSYSDERDVNEEQINLTTIAGNLYDIIELGLAENFKKHPSSEAENILLLCEQDQIEEYTRSLATKIGVDTEGLESILVYKKGTVVGICDGDEKCSQMESLLALHIASASFKNEHFFWDKDFDKNQFLNDILYLKPYRNIDKHGSKQKEINKEEIKAVMDRIYLFLIRILPHMQEDFKILNKQEYSNRKDIHTLRMEALEHLEDIFGSSFMVHLEKENYRLYDILQRTERSYLEKNGKELDEFYILLQNVFFECSRKLSGGKQFIGKGDDIRNILREKDENIPDSITTVKDKFLEGAVRGEEPQSLGASIAAFIVHCPSDDYQNFNRTNLHWMNFCNTILDKRGHANRIVDLGVERDSYKQGTYKLTKNLFSLAF